MDRLTGIHNSWRGMKERCSNPNFKQYKDYGGRGISVYQYWQKDFKSFLYWAVKSGHQQGLQLDRKDNNKGYNPCNCRWVTRKENNRNKRDTRYIEYNGTKKSLSEWCEIYGFNFKTLSNRISRGWEIERAFTTPIQKNQYA